MTFQGCRAAASLAIGMASFQDAGGAEDAPRMRRRSYRLRVRPSGRGIGDLETY